jgi:hypothetical protein
MLAACGWERGGSGQANKNKEVCRSGGVSAWEDVRMDAGGRRGGRAQGWKGGGVKHCEGQVVGGGELEGAGT